MPQNKPCSHLKYKYPDEASQQIQNYFEEGKKNL